MISILDEKKKIRQQIKMQKANLSFEEKAERSLFVLEKVENDIHFQKANTIFAYWSMSDEINTREFVDKWSKSKNIFLPVIIGDTLELRQFNGIDSMKKEGRFGILEPQGMLLENWNDIEYAIIPGVAFDVLGNRLGRGKAFYDRVLNKLRAKKIGICFDFQLIEKVPIEATDIPMDKVFSEGFGN